MFYLKFGKTPQGHMLIATTESDLVYAEIDADYEALLGRFNQLYPDAVISNDGCPFIDKCWDAYQNFFTTPELLEKIPVSPKGTEFQLLVWRAIMQMPLGTRQTYRALAEAIGQPTAARAVALACSKNTIALRIPCHRILRSDGALGGYRWGLALKQRLLNRERFGRPTELR